jgi:hypothetical protein
MRIKTGLGPLAMVLLLAFAPPAFADKLTITVQIEATNLAPQVHGVHAGCSAYFDAARQNRFGPFPTLSQEIPRSSNGTASGTVTVTIEDWVPEAKYWNCYLGNNIPGGTSGFYLPGTPGYNEVPQYRRAATGTLLLSGVVQ